MEKDKIQLSAAGLADRPMVYEWLVAAYGNPAFSPDEGPPSWEQFTQDYQDLFWHQTPSAQGGVFIIMKDGSPAGAVSFDARYCGPGACDVDIWMRGEDLCGRGYGSTALKALCRRLEDEMGFHTMIMCPSAGNRRAVSAYEKCGFSQPVLTPEEMEAFAAKLESHDSVVMIRRVKG